MIMRDWVWRESCWEIFKPNRLNQIPDILIDAEVAAAVVDDENTDENDSKEVEGSTIAAERKMIHAEELNAVENCH